MTPEEAKKNLPKASKVPKLHPMLKALPDFLKDPANYHRILKAILDVGATRHSHGEVGDWAKCQTCQAKERDRLMFMRKLGFQSAAQFKAWQSVHEEIRRRDPLVDWKASKS